MNNNPDNKHRPTRRLHIWLTAVVLCVALISTLLTAVTGYYDTYELERAEAKKMLNQLISTLEETAAISAYLDNQELAYDVTSGLVKNDIIAGAAITSGEQVIAHTGSIHPLEDSAVQKFALASPFIPEHNVGAIHIRSNAQAIEDKAQSAAFRHARVHSFHSLLIALLVMLLIDRVMTRPLTHLANELHRIIPGSEMTLDTPRWHAKDEIGGLVADVNHLLLSMRNTLNNERELRQQVEELEKHFRLLFERASAGIFLMDQQGTLRSSNKAFDQLIGLELAARMQETGHPKVTELFKNSSELQATLEEVDQNGMSSPIDLELRITDKQPNRWLQCMFSSVIDDDGKLFIEGLMNDITERAYREKNIRFEAEHDPLTGLLNRRAGKMKLLKAIEREARRRRSSEVSFALLLLDLDRFKPINDEYGHDAGDLVLKEITKRLRDSVRGEDILIRWGGDEFVLGLLKGHGRLNPVPVVEKLVAETSRSITLQDNLSVTVGASIGIALYPTHAEKLDELVSLADQAMYLVKQSGRNGYLVYGDNFSNLQSSNG